MRNLNFVQKVVTIVRLWLGDQVVNQGYYQQETLTIRKSTRGSIERKPKQLGSQLGVLSTENYDMVKLELHQRKS